MIHLYILALLVAFSCEQVNAGGHFIETLVSDMQNGNEVTSRRIHSVMDELHAHVMQSKASISSDSLAHTQDTSTDKKYPLEILNKARKEIETKYDGVGLKTLAAFEEQYKRRQYENGEEPISPAEFNELLMQIYTMY